MSPDDKRHGTRAGQQAHRRDGETPCPPCANAARRYNRNRKKLAQMGHHLRHDAAPVIAHIEALNAAGMLTNHIGRHALTIMQRRPDWIYTRTARAILNTRPQPGVNCWPALGAARRLQALSAMGHTMNAIAHELGMAQSLVSEVANQARGWVTLSPELWRKIDALYRAWGDTPGSETSRRRAARKGWVTGAAWDDIDDPDATPNLGTIERRTTGGTGRRAEHVVDDIAWLLEHDPTLTAAQLAHRLGYSDRSGVQIALTRGGRPDLLARLARNAEMSAA